MPVEGLRTRGSSSTGFKGELVGISSRLPELWEYVHPEPQPWP